jgi:hypothetical protein
MRYTFHNHGRWTTIALTALHGGAWITWLPEGLTRRSRRWDHKPTLTEIAEWNASVAL